jgi:hypothetical protein
MNRPADVHAADKEVPHTTDPLEPHDWEGDDDHVIYWMLGLTPTQRLAALQGFVESFVPQNGPDQV